MILLTSTGDLLQIVTSGTAALDVQASYVDATTSTVTPDRKNTAITTATTTSVVLSPAASTQRNVKYVSIRNRDASAANTVTVRHTDGATVVELVKFSLLAGYTLVYEDGPGWYLVDTSGARVNGAVRGRLLRSTLVTAASSTITTGPDTGTIFVRGVGAGGGGSGCTSVAAAAGGGGGGGGGAYAEKMFAVSPNTAYSYTCGAAGTGVSGAAGNNGANSTFVVGATTVTAPGGSGAVVATAATTLTARAGGAGGTVATNGDVNSGGAPGQNGFVLIVAGPIAAGGAGGSSAFGGGGAPTTTAGNGNAATGFGAGGGGSVTGASAVRTGGNGTAGCWIVEEYA